MSEKAMKSNKSIILLRSFLVFSMVTVLVFACVPFSAAAADSGVVHWEDLPNTSVVSGDSVTYTLDLTGIGKYYLVRTNPYQAWELGNNPNYVIETSGIYQFDFTTDSFSFDPLFFSNSQSDFNFSWRIQGDYGTIGHISSSLMVRYFDSSGKRLGAEQFTASPADDSGEAWHVSFDPTIPANTASINFSCLFDFSVEALGLVSVSFPLRYFNYSFTVSADSVQNKQIQDKLNGIDDKLDSLPGDIGDEMQDVIENEKEQSKGEGNKFVDQILDALPDPSTDVLAALKSLTDATAYTGTDAVLPIPAIVLPGIDGLFPETVIWEGTNFDFGEYLGFIPSTLLTLVQSLFTIAIVLFCVYELKCIISYCLTLRESKGG